MVVGGNPPGPGGEFGAPGGYFELRAVLGVVNPLAVERERLAALHAGEETDDGTEGWIGGFGAGGGVFRLGARGWRLVEGIGAELGDGVAVFLVEEDDALKDAAQGAVRIRRTGHDGKRMPEGAALGKRREGETEGGTKKAEGGIGNH